MFYKKKDKIEKNKSIVLKLKEINSTNMKTKKVKYFHEISELLKNIKNEESKLKVVDLKNGINDWMKYSQKVNDYQKRFNQILNNIIQERSVKTPLKDFPSPNMTKLLENESLKCIGKIHIPKKGEKTRRVKIILQKEEFIKIHQIFNK